MPDVKQYGAPMGAPPVQTNDPTRLKPTQPTDEQVKAAYQKYMRDVVNAAHQHFHEHVKKVRGSSQGTPSKQTSIPGVDAAVEKAQQ